LWLSSSYFLHGLVSSWDGHWKGAESRELAERSLCPELKILFGCASLTATSHKGVKFSLLSFGHLVGLIAFCLVVIEKMAAVFSILDLPM